MKRTVMLRLVVNVPDEDEANLLVWDVQGALELRVGEILKHSTVAEALGDAGLDVVQLDVLRQESE